MDNSLQERDRIVSTGIFFFYVIYVFSYVKFACIYSLVFANLNVNFLFKFICLCFCFIRGFFFFLMFVTLKFEISGEIRISDVKFALLGYVFCVLVTWNVRFGISVIVNVKNQEARLCYSYLFVCIVNGSF